MATKNDITGDALVSRGASKAYLANYDLIFRKGNPKRTNDETESEKEINKKLPCLIRLHKAIPIAAGMGGGSADAAATLVGLNELYKLGLSQQKLAEISSKIGKDVPFFIYGKNAFVEGIGEKIQEIALDSRTFLVIFPNQGIATQAIFQDPELTRNHRQITIEGFLASPWQDLSNDCQAVAMRICPEVKLALDWISLTVPGSEPRMSGSGSSVFAVLDPKTDLAKLENLLQNLPKGWKGRVVRGLNKNPAYNLVSSD